MADKQIDSSKDGKKAEKPEDKTKADEESKEPNDKFYGKFSPHCAFS